MWNYQSLGVSSTAVTDTCFQECVWSSPSDQLKVHERDHEGGLHGAPHQHVPSGHSGDQDVSRHHLLQLWPAF